METVQQIAVEALRASKTNPRQTFDKHQMSELTSSVKEKGVIVPLIARTNNGSGVFEIIAGERRWRAAKEAKLETVPVIVRQLTDAEVLEDQVIENEQRADVHPLEQSFGYERLFKLGLSLDEVGARTGKPASHVRQRLQYAKLTETAKKMFLAYEIGVLHADQIARLLPEQQKQIIDWFKKDGVPSVSELDHAIHRNFFLILKDAPFDTTDAKLVPKAGSCVDCSKRTGKNQLFADIKNQDTCTDPVCFENKTIAHVKIQVGTHPDAILLTAGRHYGNDKKLKGLNIWTKAGNSTCKDTKEGIIVEVLSMREPVQGDTKLGQVLKVCTNTNCKTHFEREPVHRSSRSDGDRAAEKARKLELRRRGLVFKDLAAKSFTVKAKDSRSILDHMIENLSSDHGRAICNAMGWETKKTGPYGGSRDYNASIATNLKDVAGEDVGKWMYLVMLAETDLWFYNNTRVDKPKLLEEKAQSAGVQLAAIAKLAKEKPSKVKKENTEKTKAKAKAKK